MGKPKNLQEISIDEIKNSNLSDDMKNVLLEMDTLYWKYTNWTPQTQGFDWKTAEGIKMCMDIIKKQ